MTSAASPSPILAGLNDAQCQAVSAGAGPYLVLAGPGSGKTRVLTHRVAYLLHEIGVYPSRLMAVTFTNKAAREMRSRIETLLGGRITGLTLGTFHATCARILRIEHENTPYSGDYAIYDTRDQLDVVKRASNDLDVDSKRHRPRGLLSAISRHKDELRGPDAAADQAQTYYGEIVARVYARYQELLVENNAVDFDDLLMQTVVLLREHPDVAEKYQRRYEYVLVDEFQDTNFAQYVLIQALAAPHDNLFAVGDPDQSIYAFRGADHRNVLRFERDYPEHHKILLEQNYRSVQNILDAAMAVIDHNPNRTPKHLFTERGQGELLRFSEAYSDDEEAYGVVQTITDMNENADYNPNECAIMYRTNAQSRAFEDAFNRAGMPYRLIGATRFYARREIKDLMAYLRAVHNPNDTFSLERVINTPPRGIGNKTLQTLRGWATEMGVSMGVALLSLRAGAEGPFSPRARRSLERFADLLSGWQTMAGAGKTPLEILDSVIDDIGFEGYLQDGTTEGQDRWDNALELRTQAARYNELTLNDMLVEVALISDVDTPDGEVDGPSLMTLHSAKGLEFPVVFLVGLGDGLLPHSRSLEEGDSEALAEERRLLYVGLTRAKDRLYLSYAQMRARYGDFDLNSPSRFLYDLPEHLLEGAPLHVSRQRSYDAFRHATSWDTPDTTRRERTPARPPVPARFQAGMRVRHDMFGEGTVIASRQYGGEEEVEVEFASSGTKRIDSNFLAPSDD